MTIKQAHILVVDDDWMNREVIEAHLSTQHYRITTVNSGAKALEVINDDPPDLVMLDILLSDISGIEVCTRIKAIHELRFIPVIVITALEGEEDKVRAIDAGADDFMTKPFSSLLLMTRVKSLLRMKRLNDELQERTDLLQQILNRHINQDIAEIILIDPDRYLKLGGETRRVTVFFGDISGFTAFAELRSAQEVVTILNKIFSELTSLIFQHHGTFDKYIGDEIMAFFGAPVATGDDTLNAVSMACKMRESFNRIRDELGPEFAGITLEMGLHIGEAVVGNVGSEQAMNYTVIGDVVNTAHRLQEAANGGQILISDDIYQEIGEMLDAKKLEPHILPGKRDPLIVYQVNGVKDAGLP